MCAHLVLFDCRQDVVYARARDQHDSGADGKRGTEEPYPGDVCKRYVAECDAISFDVAITCAVSTDTERRNYITANTAGISHMVERSALPLRKNTEKCIYSFFSETQSLVNQSHFLDSFCLYDAGLFMRDLMFTINCLPKYR